MEVTRGRQEMAVDEKSDAFSVRSEWPHFGIGRREALMAVGARSFLSSYEKARARSTAT
jgi:hypothetical protein